MQPQQKTPTRKRAVDIYYIACLTQRLAWGTGVAGKSEGACKHGHENNREEHHADLFDDS